MQWCQRDISTMNMCADVYLEPLHDTPFDIQQWNYMQRSKLLYYFWNNLTLISKLLCCVDTLYYKHCIIYYYNRLSFHFHFISPQNIFHGAMSLDQLYLARPLPSIANYRSPIKGLYICGSGSHPGLWMSIQKSFIFPFRFWRMLFIQPNLSHNCDILKRMPHFLLMNYPDCYLLDTWHPVCPPLHTVCLA